MRPPSWRRPPLLNEQPGTGTPRDAPAYPALEEQYRRYSRHGAAHAKSHRRVMFVKDLHPYWASKRRGGGRRAELTRPGRIVTSGWTGGTPGHECRSIIGTATTANVGHEDTINTESVSESMGSGLGTVIARTALSEESHLFFRSHILTARSA